MRALATAPIIAVLSAQALASPSEFDRFRERAEAGSYQDQRNYAYCLATPGRCAGASGKDDILACAWRLIIVGARHKDMDDSDWSNAKFYCRDQLDPDSRLKAGRVASLIYSKIYKAAYPPSLLRILTENGCVYQKI